MKYLKNLDWFPIVMLVFLCYTIANYIHTYFNNLNHKPTSILVFIILQAIIIAYDIYAIIKNVMHIASTTSSPQVKK